MDIFRREGCDSIIAVGGGSAMDVAKCIKLYSNIDEKLNYLQQPIIPNDVKLLAVPTTAGTGVNPVRLKNNPVELDSEAIEDIYRHILNENTADNA